MRKALVFILLFCLSISLLGCIGAKSPIDSLPKYENKVLYSNGNYQRFADYAKYEFASVDASYFEDNKFFSSVSKDNISEIREFIENFEGFENKPVEYDFDASVINESDYYYIEMLDSKIYEKLDNYTVYLFDSESSTLYYLHKNI